MPYVPHAPEDIRAMLEVLGRGRCTERADDEGFLADRDPAGAVVAVVRFQGVLQVGGRDLQGQHRVGPRGDAVGLDLAAQRVDVGDAGQGAQARTDHPVQQRPTFLQREVAAFDREHEHIGQRR